MQIKSIRTENDYREALKTVGGLMSADFGSEEGDQLDVLTTLIEAYERRAYPIEAADPIEAIKFYMEQNSLAPKDLEPMIGRMNRVYEVLGKKRSLTLPMIRNLHRTLGIPADSLISEPTARRQPCTYSSCRPV